jgi:spore germination cell wall hydrolase CwlJ-like protein
MKQKITKIAVVVMLIFLMTIPRSLENKENNLIVTEATFESKAIHIRRNTQFQKKKELITVERNNMERHMSSNGTENAILSENDRYLLALIAMAEAEGESELGKRLVIDTVLNRVDSCEFPNTIYEVIYQKNQFSSISDGRADKIKDQIDTDIYRLVDDETYIRQNYEVLYFTADHYGQYGSPAFSEGNHYFSTK